MALSVMTTTRRRRHRGFPWGLALLAGAAYLWYEHQKTGAAAPPATAPAALPPTTTTALATTTATPVASNRDIVMQWALGTGKPSAVNFAKVGTSADIDLMAQIITQEWNPGPCHNATCTQNWAYIVQKYNIQ